MPTLHARHDRRTGRIARAAIAAAAALLCALPATPASAATATATATLTPISGFANPGALGAYVYKPAGLPASAPVVVALHGCTQNAQDYADHSGLTEFADKDKFLLVFAEQSSSNNANKCFNWFQNEDITRGQGEAASIANMAGYAVDKLGGDASRVYVTGLSAGGAMTSVMLATYPDVFSAGAVMAGIPYKCATSLTQGFTCMSGVDKTPQQWADLVRSGDPGYAGPWPRVAIWHGTSDYTVNAKNADESRDQWTGVHGISQTPTKTSALGPDNTAHQEYAGADGTVLVEVNKVPNMGHGTPVHPGSGAENCGQSGQYYPDTICSSLYVTKFFGLG